MKTSLKLGTGTGSLINYLYSGMTDDKPVVGMGATILGWTDRYPATIVEVVNDKTIVIQEDHAERIDKNGMSESQEYIYSPNTNAVKRTYTLRKNGAWVIQGDSMKNGSRLLIGEREKYYDFSF